MLLINYVNRLITHIDYRRIHALLPDFFFGSEIDFFFESFYIAFCYGDLQFLGFLKAQIVALA